MSTGLTYYIQCIGKMANILRNWQIGIGNITYLDFIIYLAFATIVVKALVNKVTAGNVAENASKMKDTYKESGSGMTDDEKQVG